MKLERGPNVLRVCVATLVGASSCTRRRERDDWTRWSNCRPTWTMCRPKSSATPCRLLREAGALDVWTVPVQMKKDRPGVVLHVLVRPEAEDDGRVAALRRDRHVWASAGRRSRGHVARAGNGDGRGGRPRGERQVGQVGRDVW